MLEGNGTVRYNMAQALINVLKNNSDGVEIFLGGSCRFGLEQEHSDIDLFIYVPGGEVGLDSFLKGYNIFFNIFNNSENDESKSPLYSNNVSLNRKVKFFNEKVDLNFIIDYDNWYRLKEEHIMLDDYLQSNLELSKFLGMYPLNGVSRYRVLVTLANKNENKQEE